MSFLSTIKEFFLGPRGHVPEITPEQVYSIKRLYATGEYTQAALGKLFGVHQSQISRILSGESHGEAP